MLPAVPASADLSSLREQWTALFGIAPSLRVSRDLLVRAISYRQQEDLYGGLSSSHRRQLTQLAKGLSRHGTIDTSTETRFKPGTRLVREWKGKTHEVIITDDGYLWSGKLYASLSEIARLITGTRWSGPRFFGLEAKRHG